MKEDKDNCQKAETSLTETLEVKYQNPNPIREEVSIFFEVVADFISTLDVLFHLNEILPLKIDSYISDKEEKI